MNITNKNKLWITIAIFIATFMNGIEGTIVTTAMPTIVGSLEGMSIMNWVFAIYLLTGAMMTPIFSKLADMIGRRPVFLTSVTIFILGSALSGLSSSMVQLIIFRAIQGVGAGGILPISLTLIADLYDQKQRSKLLGLNSATWGIASIVGPLGGGMIVETFSWHWIFYINVPVGIAVILLLLANLKENVRPHQKLKLDLLGSGVLMLLLLSFLLAVQFFGTETFSLRVVCLLALSMICLVAFIFIEKSAEDPVIPLSLFKNPLFTLVNCSALLIAGVLIVVDVYIPMWLQGINGESAMIGGLVLAPLAFAWMFGSNIAGNLLEKWSTKNVLALGNTIILLCFVAFTLFGENAGKWHFLPVSMASGLGFGISFTTFTVVSQTSVAKGDIGVATGFSTLVRTLGQTILIAIFGVVLNAKIANNLPKDSAISLEDMNQLINPHTAGNLPKASMLALRSILQGGIHFIFLISLVLLLVVYLVILPMREGKRKTE
ncbi:drug resistance transporter, EmrB/QacA subfamily [Pilibacter termitis]|uniref:Drug resistance transporter, EmrB/QacA subfamily n=1 Tax=Pilibacter termitis TaxID=263852 RepID=A0A1T4P5K8_9ENTE|nr:MFS transporter [Pilibacter termitis]SJZ86722.1 drug resistance transporter, EmrB/QacA subfamily [Pilibacter termitis]